jgi:glycosyltransferase involved in cell wall biosynthesis
MLQRSKYCATQESGLQTTVLGEIPEMISRSVETHSPTISEARGSMPPPDSGPDRRYPLVSVIVPAFNSAWCIERTLKSIAGQTYPNLEVIVVNDGSTDNTASVIRSCIAGDARFRVVDQDNRGLVGARNRGIEEARGVYIAPVDADDLWHPDYVASQVAMLEQADPGTPFVFCYSYWIDENDDVYPTSAPARPPRADFIGLLRENAVGNGSCSVFRREKLLEAGRYDASLKQRGALGGEDWKLSLLLTARHPASVNPQFLVGYRRTAGSLSADPTNQTKSLLIVLSDVRKQFPDVPSHHFWAARTDFLIWLLPRWAGSGKWAQFAKYAALAFLGNPFWMFDEKARRNAVSPVKMLIRRLLPLPARPAAPLRPAAEIGLLPEARKEAGASIRRGFTSG